jgi:hypothetical protein
MNVGKTLFAQIMEFIPWTSFSRIVQRYGGDAGVRRLTCSEQFRVMAFAQSLMASPNSPTRGHPKFPQAAPSDYDPSAWMAKRAAASLSL